MSVATARNGTRSSSKLATEQGNIVVSRTYPSLLPAMSPGGRTTPPFLKFSPNSIGIRCSKSSSFCRKDCCALSGASWKSVSHLIPLMTSSISSGVKPQEYMPPAIEPMLVPAM